MPKYSESFLRFYKVYPVKKGKFEANKKWLAWKLEKIEPQIIKHVTLSKQYDTDWKLNRIPYASTYINQRRWEDEIAGCYREPQTDNCVPVKKIPRQVDPDSPKIREIRNKINVEGRRMAKMKSWHNPEDRALMANLNRKLKHAESDARKLGDLIKKPG